MPPSVSRLLALVLMLALAGAARAGTRVDEAGDAPAWSEEAPAVARLLEGGYQAEQRHLPGQAAARYCAAAREGSTEGQFRLGRLYLMGQGVPRDNQLAVNLLAAAAERGHERARSLLGGLPAGDRLPDCLTQGTPPETAVAATDEVVPQEVVDRYVRALPPEKRRHALLIQKLAPRFSVDARLALAIARTESNFEAAARSPKNALGLMQLIPDTAERFGVRDALDPEQNIRGGLAYLRVLLAQFKGDVALTAAAYNAGEGAVTRHGGVPPYAETQEYVRRILNFYRASRHAAQPARVAAAGGVARG